MKVIKKGKLPKAKPYVGTCGNCGCVIEVPESEVTWVEDRGQDHPCWDKGCPTAGCRMSTIYLKEKYEGEILNED